MQSNKFKFSFHEKEIKLWSCFDFVVKKNSFLQGTSYTLCTYDDTSVVSELIKVLKETKQTVPSDLLELVGRRQAELSRGYFFFLLDLNGEPFDSGKTSGSVYVREMHSSFGSIRLTTTFNFFLFLAEDSSR